MLATAGGVPFRKASFDTEKKVPPPHCVAIYKLSRSNPYGGKVKSRLPVSVELTTFVSNQPMTLAIAIRSEVFYLPSDLWLDSRYHQNVVGGKLFCREEDNLIADEFSSNGRFISCVKLRRSQVRRSTSAWIHIGDKRQRDRRIDHIPFQPRVGSEPFDTATSSTTLFSAVAYHRPSLWS